MTSPPPGWAMTQLRSVTTKIGSGATPKGGHESYAATGVPLIRSLNVHFDGVRLEGLAHLNDEQAAALANVEVAPNDVLLNITGASIGRVAVAPAALGGARVNQHVAIIRLKDGVEPAFVRLFLASPGTQDLIGTTNYGATRPALTKASIEEMELPLPPVAEQRRIVAKLDALTARTARARADLDRIPALAARYKQAVLAKAFNGDLSPPQQEHKFARVALSTALVSTFYGPRFAKEAYADRGIPTLRTTDFDDAGRVIPKEPPKVQVSDKDLAKWGLQDGDLLVTRTGSIGKCAVYEARMGPALPSAYLIRARLDRHLLDPKFALLFLLSREGQEQLGLGITAVTQPNINAGVIERLMLPLPPLETQRLIVSKVDSAFAEIDRLAAEAAAARRLLDRLDQAVLAKAFRGGLVPQDPNDEPASVMLDRIRGAQGEAPKPRRGRRAAA